MTNSVTASLTFLYTTLSGDATFAGKVSGVYRGVAPEGSLPDYCIMLPQAMPKTLSATAGLIMTRGLYQVRISGPEADYTNISSAWDRAISLLGLVRFGAGTLDCYLEQDLFISEIVDGVPWVNLGGLFRIEV